MTFKEAFNVLVAELHKHGWIYGIGSWPGTNYKVSYVQSPDKTKRIWFKEHSMLYTTAGAHAKTRHTFGNARRCMAPRFDLRAELTAYGAAATVEKIYEWLGIVNELASDVDASSSL